MTGLLTVPVGVKLCRLLPLRELKSKTTTVKIIAVPLKILSGKNMTGTICRFMCCFRIGDSQG